MFLAVRSRNPDAITGFRTSHPLNLAVSGTIRHLWLVDGVLSRENRNTNDALKFCEWSPDVVGRFEVSRLTLPQDDVLYFEVLFATAAPLHGSMARLFLQFERLPIKSKPN